MGGRVLAISISDKKGVQKKPVTEARILKARGIEGDAHAGDWHRQVSLLANESAEKMRAKGLKVGPGAFAENITTEGVDLLAIPLGGRIRIGSEVELELTQIGKECHDRCAIYYAAGDCVMPREGVFARVLRGGTVRAGDAVKVKRSPFSFGIGEWTGAMGDLGLMLPVLLALSAAGSLDLGRALMLVGLTYIVSGWYFRVPLPVQPLKAATAIAIARGLGAGVIKACALWMGAILLLLSFTGLSKKIERLFTKPIVRGIQFGVGLLLIKAAYQVLISYPGGGAGLMPAAVPWLPSTADIWTAFWVLVVPQIPLTLGNSVFATCDAAGGYFGAKAARVEPAKISLSLGLANVAAGFLGGLPVCHGSAGVTAHYKFGARTGGATIILGSVFILLGVIGSGGAAWVFRLVPGWVLGSLLAYTGLRHALLVRDIGARWPVPVMMGLVGFATQNLTWALGLGLAAEACLTARSLKPV